MENTECQREDAPNRQPLNKLRGAEFAVREPSRSRVLAFEWPVPWWASGNTSLLAVITSDNDPITTNELAIATLIPNSTKCGLKRVTVIT